MALTVAPVGAQEAEVHRRSVTMLLTTTTGESLGSAVVVGLEPGGRWLVTSRHVVDTFSRVCVVPAFDKAGAAQVMPSQEPPSRLALDVAFLWQPTPWRPVDLTTRRPLAVFADPMPDASVFPVVTASGFPAPVNIQSPLPRYTETTGLLMPLLQQPIEGGFDLTSTVAVGKGMSGGGLFLDDRLVGINGTHAHPLWSGVLLSNLGKPLDPALTARLELVSLGVSAPTIRRKLQKLVKPTARELQGLDGLSCAPLAPAPQTP
jgi:hypothetical protein